MKKQIRNLFIFFVMVGIYLPSNAQTYLNVLTKTTVELTQDNINAYDYLTTSISQNWTIDKNYCGIQGVFFNMSKIERQLNIDVSNVSSFDLYINCSAPNAPFYVSIAGEAAQQFTHQGTGCEKFSFNTNNLGDIRIALSGGGTSVYPVKIVLNPGSELNLKVGGIIPAFNATTNTYKTILPKTYDLTQTVTFTLPSGATANFTSGNSHDFSSPLNMTVTAQDMSTTVYTITAQNAIADIVYVTRHGYVNDTTIYPHLVSLDYYIKTIMATGTDLSQFDPYDLVVLTSEPVGTAGITLIQEMGKLITTKPFLNFKYSYYSQINWPVGTSLNSFDASDIAIKPGYESHPIFNGVTIADSKINILSTPTTTGLGGVTGYDASNNTLIGTLTTSGYESSAAILENNKIPSAKYMMISIPFTSYATINSNGLKVIENAVSYLLNSTLYGSYTETSINYNHNITFDGTTVRNTKNQQIQIYDVIGRLIISSNQDINMSSYSKGIYVVKSTNGQFKISLTK